MTLLVDIPGRITLAYAKTGEGPPLVLMHGGEADHTQYDRFVTHLAGVTALPYSQRDCGQTTNPDVEFGIEELADDAAAFIRALGLKRAHVFGSSLGSVIAQALVVRHPDVVDRLVLSAAIRIGESIPSINPEAAAELGKLRADPAANAAAIARYFYTEAHLAAHPELAQRFAGGKRPPHQQARRNALIPKAPRLDLSRITAPTLVLAQEQDRLVPAAHTLSIAREIPGAKTALLERLGHVGTIEAPGRVDAAILPFLLDAAS